MSDRTVVPSDTIASTAAESMANGTCWNGKSGGQRTRRRATPSSSMSANAAASWSLVEMSTDRPRSSSARPPRTEPRASSARVTHAWGPPRKFFEKSPECQSEARLLCGILIKADEVADGYRKGSIFGGGSTEWVDSQHVLEPGDD